MLGISGGTIRLSVGIEPVDDVLAAAWRRTGRMRSPEPDRRQLTLLDAICIMLGIVVGSGIFTHAGRRGRRIVPTLCC